MIRLLISGLLVASVSMGGIASAQALTLAWDRNPETDLVTHYQVYWCAGLSCPDTALIPVPGGVVLSPTAPTTPTWSIPEGFVGRLAVTALNLAYTDTSVTPALNVSNESEKSASISVNAKRGGKPTNPRIRR